MIYVLALGILLGQAFFYGLRAYARRKRIGLVRALWRLFTGYRVRSTPTHLVVERRHQVDWARVRELEFNMDGLYYHSLTGEPYGSDGMTKEQEAQDRDQKFGPMTSLDRAYGYQLAPDREYQLVPAIGSLHRCRNCGTAENVWKSSVDGHWRCHKRECQPCWCTSCNGRIGVHGEDAVALYYDQVEAAIKALTNKGIVS